MSENIIRQDVVQIGFSIENNPFRALNEQINSMTSGLTGPVRMAQDGLDDMGRTARTTAGEMNSVTDAANGLGRAKTDEIAGDMQKTANESQKAAKGFSQMARELGSGVTAKLREIPEKLRSSAGAAREFASSLKANAVEKVTAGVGKLKEGLGNIQNLSLKDVTQGLGKGLEKATTGASALFGKLKGVVGVSFGKMAGGLSGVAGAIGPVIKGFAKLNLAIAKVLAHNFGKLAKGIAGGLAKALKWSIAGLATGIPIAAGGIFKLTDMASDLSETMNKVSVSFGSGGDELTGAAKEVEAWSKNSIKSMGLAQQTALDTAALFGDMATSMGLEKGDAADMSMDLTQRAADIASFKNMDVDEVTTALNGIFTGETESLKRLGVVMTQTNLDAFAMANGFGKTTANMTEAEKVSLRYQFVLAKTANSMGDFERTGGGFANQLRMFKEQMKEAGTSLGQAFLPSLTQGLVVLNGFGVELNEVFKIIGTQGFTDENLTKVGDIFGRALSMGASALQAELPKLIKVLVTSLGIALDTVVGILPMVLTELVRGATQLLQGLIASIRAQIPALGVAAAELVSEFAGFFLQSVPEIILVGMELLLALVDGIVAKIPTLLPMALGVVNTFIGGVLESLPKLLQAGIRLVLALAQGIVQVLPEIVLTAGRMISTFIMGVGQMIPQIIEMGIQLLISLVTGLIESLPAIVQSGVQIVIAFAGGLIQAIPALVAAVPKLIVAILEAIFTTDWLQVGKDIIAGIGKGLWDGVKGFFGFGAEAGQAVCAGIQSQSATVQHTASEFGYTATGGMGENLYEAYAYGAQSGTNMAMGLKDTVHRVAGAAGGMANAAQTGLSGAYAGASATGAEVASQFASGLESQMGMQNLLGGYGGTPVGLDTAGAVEELKKLETAVAASVVVIKGKLGELSGEAIPMNTSGALAALTALEARAQGVTTQVQQVLEETKKLSGVGITLDTSGAQGALDTLGAKAAGVAQVIEGIFAGLQAPVRVRIGLDAGGIQETLLGLLAKVRGVGEAIRLVFAGLQAPAPVEIGLDTSQGRGALAELMAKVRGVAEATALAFAGVEIPTWDFDPILTQATEAMEALALALTLGFYKAKTLATGGAKAIGAAIGKTNLYAAGYRMMSGLTAGLLSGRGQVLGTVSAIAGQIQSTLNRALDIHSPSRVLMESGTFAIQGLDMGMEQMRPQVEATSHSLGRTVAEATMSPVERIGYTPQSSEVTGSGSRVENNSYAPVFNLSVTGSSSGERDFARKVEGLVRLALEEYFESMSRRNPRLTEV